jgi:hypothetical protein
VLPVVLALLWLAAPWPGSPSRSALAADTDEGPPSVDFVAPALPYTSIFTGYRKFRDEPVGSWPAANDTVGRLGGWRYYLEEAAEPDPAEAAPPPSAPPAPQPGETAHPAGHGGHR